MKHLLLFSLICLFSIDSFSQAKPFSYGGERRRFTIYLPSTDLKQPDKNYPLVFNFHGDVETQEKTEIKKSKELVFRRCFIGSSFFMLGNFSSNNKPDFAQLNLGYRITPKDVVSIEPKTWKYAWSLGIPYGKSFEAPDEKFPGYIREYGFALAYQRFWWKGLYTGINVMNAWQSFVNDDGNKIDNGFQIFNTYRVGYHIKLFKDRFFIEPSIAVTHRPYHTKMPESFKQLDDKQSKFFFGEPGLHFGFNF